MQSFLEVIWVFIFQGFFHKGAATSEVRMEQDKFDILSAAS